MALTVFIPLKPYLAQWLVHKHGGELPITLKRNSPESLLLERFLRTRPRKGNYTPKVRAAEGEVPIAVPVFKYKDPRTYNFLPEKGVCALRQCIRISFAVELWHDLYTVGKPAATVLTASLAPQPRADRGHHPQSSRGVPRVA